MMFQIQIAEINDEVLHYLPVNGYHYIQTISVRLFEIFEQAIKCRADIRKPLAILLSSTSSCPIHGACVF